MGEPPKPDPAKALLWRMTAVRLAGIGLAVVGLWLVGALPIGEASRFAGLGAMLGGAALVVYAPRIVRGPSA